MLYINNKYTNKAIKYLCEFFKTEENGKGTNWFDAWKNKIDAIIPTISPIPQHWHSQHFRIIFLLFPTLLQNIIWTLAATIASKYAVGLANRTIGYSAVVYGCAK